MQMAATVNSSAEDGGLAQVFTVTGVNSLITAKLTAEGVTTLMEFTNMWTKAGYETEATEYRNEVESLKDVRVEGSRLRAAIVLARAVLDRPPINAEDKAINDWECPLDAAAKESISKSWKARYGVVLTMYLDPADPLVNRLYREFRQNSPSLIPVAKIRSVYVDHNPSPEKKVHLPGGMSITVAGQEQKEVVRDVAHYYYALRILANASAKAGGIPRPVQGREGRQCGLRTARRQPRLRRPGLQEHPEAVGQPVLHHEVARGQRPAHSRSHDQLHARRLP